MAKTPTLKPDAADEIDRLDGVEASVAVVPTPPTEELTRIAGNLRVTLSRVDVRPLVPGDSTLWSVEQDASLEDYLFTPVGDVMQPGLRPLVMTGEDIPDPILRELQREHVQAAASHPYRQYLERLIRRGKAWGAFHKNRLLGFVAAEPIGSGRMWRIWLFLVQPDFQRVGLGGEMLDRLAESVKATGAHSLITMISGNYLAKSPQFLARHGFAEAMRYPRNVDYGVRTFLRKLR